VSGLEGGRFDHLGTTIAEMGCRSVHGLAAAVKILLQNWPLIYLKCLFLTFLRVVLGKGIDEFSMCEGKQNTLGKGDSATIQNPGWKLPPGAFAPEYVS
jgi:hypothetical protein